MDKKVAIPGFQGEVAPRFESAEKFMIVTIADGAPESSEVLSCVGCEGFGRVRLLESEQVEVLICSGIKSFYRGLLESLGITVLENVSMTLEQALSDYLAGNITAEPVSETLDLADFEIPHEDLLCWSRDLFRSNGYQVTDTAGKARFPIDLIATIECPVCHKPIRTAICCGAHTYRADQEIREFHHATVAAFHARVYVHVGSRAVCDGCRAYGIQLIDPNDDEFERDPRQIGPVPLLRNPVAGHERAFGEN
jgi:predicted Fe-Mo cluster-binding NifX family protein